MSDIILNHKEQDVLAGKVETSILTPADIAKIKARSDIIQLKKELEEQSPQWELLKALKEEIATTNQGNDNQSDAITAAMTGAAWSQATTPEVIPQEAPKQEVVQPPQWAEIQEGNLPVAPVTTFNIIRLIQLGYIPLEKPKTVGVINSPKWVFYWLNAATQWGNGKIGNLALDWSNSKWGSAYRSMLDADIWKINDELKAYQKSTATVFGVKVELEKQLALLESLKTERDPKKILSLATEYTASRSKTNFSHGAVGYTNPAVRKTVAELDVDMAKAEKNTDATEKRIADREKDLKALTTKWALDSSGNVRLTQEEIEANNKKRIERATILSDQRIATVSANLTAKQTEVQKFQTEFDATRAKITQTEWLLGQVKLNDRGRAVVDINADIAALGTLNKTNKQTFDELQKELRVTNQRIAYEAELARLWSIDSRWNPVAPVPPATSAIHEAHTDLQKAKTDVTALEKKLKTAQWRKDKLLRDASEKWQADLDAHKKAVELANKHITQGGDILTKRKEAEVKITELNGKIKATEIKLAGSPTTSERLKLEADLRDLYAQKNAAAHTFTAAIESNKGRNDTQTQTAVEWQSKEVQKELAKLNQLSTEMNGVKTKIDAIQAEVEAAKNALNNEKDPVKAKKLRDEMPAKINAANSQIFELNLAGSKICTTAWINWRTIPDLELKSVLQRNLLLSKFLAAPQGAIARVEWFGQTPGGQKTMKMVYGGLKWVWVAGAARTIGNEIHQGKMKEAWLDAFDAGMWFIGMVPGLNIISGVYDIGMAGKQFITGTDINGRKVSTTQSFVRLGFGIVGLIPVVGNVVKWAAAARWAVKVVGAVEKVESAANIAMKTAILGQAGTIAYDVVDVTANMFREPVADVAMRVVRGQEQPGIFFPKSVTK